MCEIAEGTWRQDLTLNSTRKRFTYKQTKNK
jgi:hypothetical protein